ncbi:ABC transporter ATP-binding protein [Peptacetobacter hominis]|uniref:ABC transporter ATP-binding protein n=1 Tax=Peptacetobacter hominis TaxID=2743610 RepID=A0A544QWM6_9FIRM|nr:energy-coupling factor transporter ATPase [Peptacetobacter hominis]TQQ85093.1 ABC transporter ATP-binding protein [Peptacetobacter hominis]
MSNIIEIKNLTYSYPGSSEPILNNISVNIEKGDFLAVIGNNGCGKSTLCKTMNGLIPHFIAGDYSGEVLIDGENTIDLTVGNLARKVGYVYQDFENQIVRPTVLDDASYACLNYAMDDYEQRGMTALKQCGLEDKKDEFVWQLSGGQTHLLALAGVTSIQPDVIILDEPIAQLDPRHADKIYEVLKELNEKYDKTIIVIEHHTEYIADYCKNVLFIDKGTAKWKLPVKEALAKVDELEGCNIFPPQVTSAARMLQKKNIISDKENLPVTIADGINSFSKLKYNKEKNKDVKEYKPESTGTSVSFKDVSVSYSTVKGGRNKIYNGLNLDIREGEKIALIGSNGAGKTTLMKMMIGLIKAEGGSITIGQENINDMNMDKISRAISLVYQNPEEMFIKDSIESDIAYAMKVRNIEGYEEKTRELLERFNLTELKDRDGRLLSGGQMRRASLAIGIALKPEILLLDEPTANLDIATRKEIIRTLSDIKDATKTVIIATHDMQLVCEWADRIIVLKGGEVIKDGNKDDIFGDENVLIETGIRPPEIFSMAKALDESSLCYTIKEFVESFEVIEDGKNNEKIVG